MKKSKFSEAQIAFVLKQAKEGATIGDFCRKTGISEATFYAWRKRCPASIRVDQGSEFISRDLDLWAYILRDDLGARARRSGCETHCFA